MRTYLAAATLLLAAGCSSVHVATDHDDRTDFAAIATFTFAEGAAAAFGGNTLVANRAVEAVARELAAKGLRRTDGDADVSVAFHTASRDRTDVTTWPAFGAGWRRRRAFGGWGYDRVSVNQWTEGTIVVDLVDPATRDLLWRGSATSVLDDDSGSAERIDAAMHALFERYPPPER